MAEPDEWCFAWYALDPAAQTGKTRAAMLREAMWTPGETITLFFLDGEPKLKAKVMQYASMWTGSMMANLELAVIRSQKQADIRVSFLQSGDWSVIGNTCRFMKEKLDEPTLNLGSVSLEMPEEKIRRAVLHEFGHALGLVHEHQNPAGGIQWNRAQVLADLTPPKGRWTAEQVENNMFAPVAAKETNFTPLDVSSIMMYPIPPAWTENGFTTVLNTNLSRLDRAFIREQYH